MKHLMLDFETSTVRPLLETKVNEHRVLPCAAAARARTMLQPKKNLSHSCLIFLPNRPGYKATGRSLVQPRHSQ